jgi:hypothetical protein
MGGMQVAKLASKKIGYQVAAKWQSKNLVEVEGEKKK